VVVGAGNAAFSAAHAAIECVNRVLVLEKAPANGPAAIPISLREPSA
jgi:succinate dehydrogenase/fumarate reductase flavoprotein subunit